MAQPDFRVLHIVSSLGMGGAETWLLQLLKHWRRSPEGAPKVDILVTSGNRSVFDDEAEALGARVFYARYSRREVATFIRRFRRLLRTGNYAAIHDHQDYSSGWRFLMGTGLLPPVRVTHFHGPMVVNVHATRIQRIFARAGGALLIPYASFISSTSRKLLDDNLLQNRWLRHIPKSAVYCGFDIKRFVLNPAEARAALRREFIWPEDAKVILFAGRADKWADIGNPTNVKNSALATAIGIDTALRDRRIHMLFAGALSTGVQILEQRIAKAGLSTRIKFLGLRKDIEQLMLGSDALLFPSRFEGLGMVAVEAQAAGLPVVASTMVPSEAVVVPEIFERVGLDATIDVWTEAILAAINRERPDFSECRSRVERSRFSISNSAKQLEAIYRGEMPCVS
ncbi:MAG TPA: glycosyltransferase [Terracidiphilus sp.]|nr:glycosyltransferase [Terracidiphilus sp.]